MEQREDAGAVQEVVVIATDAIAVDLVALRDIAATDAVLGVVVAIGVTLPFVSTDDVHRQRFDRKPDRRDAGHGSRPSRSAATTRS